MTPAKSTEYHRTWRSKNREHLRQYKELNKEKRKEINAKYYNSHRSECIEYMRKWRRNNPDKCKTDKNAQLKMTYGITLDDYNKLLLEQHGCCAICGKSESEYKRRLHVDHNHSNRQVRGILCVRCNSGLGNFQENLELLENAKMYLTKYAKLEKV